MRKVDAPIPRLYGRTPRELLIVVTGVLMLAHCVSAGDTSGNGPAIAIVTLAFATRFFAARVAAMALCVSALALALAHVIDPRQHALDMAPHLVQFSLGALVLASRDLRARFDDGGRGVGRFRNFWRDVPPADRRSIARVTCAGAATASLLHHAHHAAALWSEIYAPPWTPVALVALAGVAGALLIAGRSLGLVLGAAFAGLTIALYAPRMHEARFAMAGAEKTVARWLDPGGGYVLVAVPAAAITLALTAPWLARLAKKMIA
jgi:hypothetical protein